MSNPEQPPREEGAGETLRPDAEVLPTSTEIKDAEREEQQAEHARSAEERNRLGEELTTTPIAENVPRQEEVTRENTTEETSNETPNEPPGIFRRSINKLKEKFNNSKASVKNFFKTSGPRRWSIGLFWGFFYALKVGWEKAIGSKGGGGGSSPKKSSGGGHGGGHH